MTIPSQFETEEALCLTQIYDENPKYQVVDCESGYDGLQSRNSKIYILNGDITKLQVDAIVCPTQTNLHDPPVGLCSVVWRAGGPVLKQTCLDQRRLDVGTSFITEGYKLPSKYVIFTAGPTPSAPYNYEERLKILQNSYTSSLNLVREKDDIRTVAFPSLGTGGGDIRLSDANKAAARAIREWLEDDVNRNSVDVIVLCMFCEEQREDCLKQLLRVFPYGLDVKGNNLEDLVDVPADHLDLPRGSTSTSILCYQYQPEARRHIGFHFYGMVDSFGENVKHELSLSRRYRNCVIFKQKLNFQHQVVIKHSYDINMIEVQVTRFSDYVETIRRDICERLQESMSDYFHTHIENITDFKSYVRCYQASWGQIDGLWKFNEIEALTRGHITCDKHKHSSEYHYVMQNDLLKYWTELDNAEVLIHSGSFQNNQRQPVELSIPSSEESSSSRADSRNSSFAKPSRTDIGGSKSLTTTRNTQDTTRPKSYIEPRAPVDHTENDSTTEKRKHRKKPKLTERIKSNKPCVTEESRQLNRQLLMRCDSGHETSSEYKESSETSSFSRQVSIQSSNLKLNTPVRDLENKNLIKLGKQMGSSHRKVGLYLELTDTDIDNAVAKAEKDTELYGYYIIKKWMSMNEEKADIGSLLKVYRECDIDTYHFIQEFGLS